MEFSDISASEYLVSQLTGFFVRGTRDRYDDLGRHQDFGLSVNYHASLSTNKKLLGKKQ